MALTGDFYTLWREVQGKGAEDGRPPCATAEKFERKMNDTIFTWLAQGATRAQIAQAKFYLQEEWHAWRPTVPETHRRFCSTHHQCLDDVYHACYDRLHLMELSLRPPLNIIVDFYELTRPSTPPPPQIAGIFLGELTEKE